MSAENFDIVILGGGLAGLSTAVYLAENTHLSIGLVDMRNPGSNHTIRSVYQDSIEKFGLEDAVLRNYQSFIFHSIFGTYLKFDYENRISCAVDYSKACQILCTRARSNGVEFRKERALSLLRASHEPKKRIGLQLSGNSTIMAQVLVDASGPSQWAARQLGIRPSRSFSCCYGERLRGCPIDDYSAFRFLTPHRVYGNGGGWFYPLEEGVASFGYSIVVPHGQMNRGTAFRYQSAKKEFPPYSTWFAQAKREFVEGGMIPIGRIGQFCNDRLICVGDAAGQANSWSVEGCRPALENGLTAGQVIQMAFVKNRFDRETLSIFEEKWNKENRERFWRTESVSEITWNRTEKEWEKFLKAYQTFTPEQQYWQLRENRVSWLWQVYALGGYARRQMVNWLGLFIKGNTS
jgi:flavin-dependent dehydrogenase